MNDETLNAQTGQQEQPVADKKPRRKKKSGRGPPPPHNSTTSVKAIQATKRRREALQLRLQSYTYRQIAEHLNVSHQTIADDINRALNELTHEPAQQLFRMEMSRLDEMAAAFYTNACEGDIPAAQMMLRIMAHRAHLLGWGTKEHTAKLTITDAVPGAAAPRAMSIEFVIPGARIASMSDDDPVTAPPWTPPSMLQPPDETIEEAMAKNVELKRKLRIKPEATDLVLDAVTPESLKRTQGSFDWED